MPSRERRCFLLLQGPHGPFFDQLGAMLRQGGCDVWRVGFNAGDAMFWRRKSRYIPFQGRAEEWPDRFTQIITETGATDLVLYGDVRPIHATAIARAKARGLTIHVFEEGYMRPYWVTYERNGSNGHSRLMRTQITEMRAALAQSDEEAPLPPAHWGDMREHIFYGALYHWFVMALNGSYRNFKPHRDLSVFREFLLYLRTILTMPAMWILRVAATFRIHRGGYPYHVALLQLEHDPSVQRHSPFGSMNAFIETVVDGFARGAPAHHHLVFKAHPLEDGRINQRRAIKRAARACGIADRVHYLRGGKLAALLDSAHGAVTINSTAGQQVLWRGLPLKIFGRAVYGKPELVSAQPLANFFAHPDPPDMSAYRDYRRYLLETSQRPGGFYSARGRRQLLRDVVDLMLRAEDPYDALVGEPGTTARHLTLVGGARVSVAKS
ncbi:capsule biosynthesis protein [Cognatishimia sp. F0-27]|uniref:capsule biosynthesis protein n=1 Tax=Cognatishimia sp. F0-27 TaxID=2816855 RepID=UPI001D0C4606|nr:capsule biosynthesis protein CapA [Cognatishimia sp. F0-27]MCC1491740.1 capsule biosynthesis protein CapA [Cognatishimia sp. F0-27]